MCGSHEMMCSVDNKCINLAFQCDGISHCSDGSDEQDCNKGIINIIIIMSFIFY